jgi:hypothetical protein
VLELGRTQAADPDGAHGRSRAGHMPMSPSGKLDVSKAGKLPGTVHAGEVNFASS